MTYFRELPNIEYQSFLNDRQSSQDYILIKNLFRRCKIRDDLNNILTLFNKYTIKDGYRPELVALEVYGSVEYDWVVIITSGITNIRDQWPLSNKHLLEYCEKLYGNDLYNIHHYETVEIKDDKGRLILPAGRIVNEDFKISYYDSFGALYTNDSLLKLYSVVATSDANAGSLQIPLKTFQSGISMGDFLFDGENKIEITGVNLQSINLSSPISTNISDGDVLNFDRHFISTIENPVIGVTNYEYEVRKNEEKSLIYILKPEYLKEVLKDIRRELFYDESSQYIDFKTIRTENTRNTSP